MCIGGNWHFNNNLYNREIGGGSFVVWSSDENDSITKRVAFMKRPLIRKA